MKESKSLTDKIKSVGKLIGRKVILPLTLITAGVLYSQNTNAQEKRLFPSKLDHGAEFYQGKTNSNYSLEEKVFFNPVTGKEERFYVQYINKDKYSNDLDVVALDFYKTIPRMNLQTGKVGELRSEEGMYVYFPEKLDNGQEANSIVIDNLHIADWCEDQIRERAGVKKGINYISITDMEKLLPEQERLKLGDNRRFIVLTIPKEKQVAGKTNHYLIPVNDKYEIGFNPETKKLTIYGPGIYRGNLEKGVVAVDTKTGTVKTGIGTELGRDSTFVEADTTNAKPKEKSPSKLSLIVGGEGNGNAFWTGELGIQYGPLAIVGNIGKGANEYFAKDITTPSSPFTGRYGYGKTDHTNLKVKGIKLEAHLFNNKFLSPFIGGGINNWTYTTKDVEQIKRPDTDGDPTNDVLKEKSNTRAESDNSLQGDAGVNIRLGKNGKAKLRLEAGYDTKAKFFGGAGFSFSLN